MCCVCVCVCVCVVSFFFFPVTPTQRPRAPTRGICEVFLLSIIVRELLCFRGPLNVLFLRSRDKNDSFRCMSSKKEQPRARTRERRALNLDWTAAREKSGAKLSHRRSVESEELLLPLS